MTDTTHLIYLHGFRSSPQSFKARRMAKHTAMRKDEGRDLQFVCPQLPPSPFDAMALIESLVAAWPTDTMAVIGSSLGGFYATVLAERRGCRVAVINPAVAPARDLARYIGEQTFFHTPEDRFFFREAFIAEFQSMAPYPISRPERYWTLFAQGDEVLDWREMVSHYPQCPGELLPGGDHAVTDFEPHIQALVRALHL